MDQDQDFSSLRNLLALKRLDMPNDTQVDQFLIEFHRRQRAQLLVPQSVFARATAWVKEHAFAPLPSLSYAAVAVIAITAFASLSQQVQVTHVDGQSRLSFRMMPTHDTSFAMLPGSLGAAPAMSTKLSDSTNFAPAKAASAATRYVLANNAHGAYDATVAF